MGMNLSGKWKIKAKVNEVTGKVSYRTSLVQKDKDGKAEFYTVFLNLVKDARNKAIDDNQYIIVKPENAWLGFYRKDNETQIVANVMDFDYADLEGFEIKQEDTGDDLPF